MNKDDLDKVGLWFQVWLERMRANRPEMARQAWELMDRVNITINRLRALG